MSSNPSAPYVFIDVDGVLNALLRPRDAHDHRFLTVNGVEYPIHIRHSVLDWLRALGERADVRWATTWQDHANEVLAPAFDLPVVPVACRTEDQHGMALPAGRWKTLGVIAAVSADARPFVWIDDEAIPVEMDDLVDEFGVPYLCIEPDQDLGLSDDQIAEIDGFLARHR